MYPAVNNATSLTTSRNILHYKWDTLFDIEAKEWIAVKPTLGLQIYSCYSCRHLFYSKKSFQDHINRRAIVLVYKCPGCNNKSYTFHNRCILLLHCRKHYMLSQGVINLNNLEVKLIDLDLVGFSKHPKIPYFYDVHEEYVIGDVFPNSQFYIPKPEDRGKDVIILTPSHLVVNRTDTNGQNISLALKQVAHNIPKCLFITLDLMNELSAKTHVQLSNESLECIDCEIDIKNENNHIEEELISDINLSLSHGESNLICVNDRDDSDSLSNNASDDFSLPVITKIETIKEIPNFSEFSALTVAKCFECEKNIHDDMKDHFIGLNKPVNTNFTCNMCHIICATECSFTAHKRIHVGKAPYVCPDCGIQFNEFLELFKHMEKVCYHMMKSVRIRCPGKRCGKLFVSENTFIMHFQQAHIAILYRCLDCNELFKLLEDCQEHCHAIHKDGTKLVKFFTCSSCNAVEMSETEKDKHVDQHSKGPIRRLYVYKCKFCKCYFRSVATLSSHLQNCKIQKMAIPSKYISQQCVKCNLHMICLRDDRNPLCKRCKLLQSTNNCLLCKEQINSSDWESHKEECKYGRVQVLVVPLTVDKFNHSFNSSTSDLEESIDGSINTKRDSSDDNRPRKRSKPIKPKKPDYINDLTADEPILFDGTYSCRLCSYEDSKRESFHVHIKSHRQISTVCQCMECGECFMVKPTLTKHLTHYHNITNCEKYFEENECFDEGAIKDIAKFVKAPYLANNVKDNQCGVCLKQFKNKESHDKHFRIHGMAFLMTKSK